jgi:hypothetical protein
MFTWDQAACRTFDLLEEAREEAAIRGGNGVC